MIFLPQTGSKLGGRLQLLPSPRRSGILASTMMRVQAMRPRLLPWRTLTAAASGMVPSKQSKHLSGALCFEDPSAFRVKSFGELLRALGIFYFCSFPVLVNNCGKVRFGRHHLDGRALV